MKLYSYPISECETKTINLTNKINSNKQAYGLKEDERIRISFVEELELIPYPNQNGLFFPKEYPITISVERFWNESFLDDDITEIVDIERSEYVIQPHIPFVVDSFFFSSSESTINLEKKVVEHLDISK